jgi:probable rRNA maturation factor
VSLRVECAVAPGVLLSRPEGFISFMIKHLQAAAHVLGAAGELRVRLVADAEMSAAHERFSGVAGTTDVLTFDLRECARTAPPPTLFDIRSDHVRNSYEVDADVFVCVDEAQRQASDRGYPLEKEALLYALHGLLHCLGHDDHDEAAYQAMHALEDALLDAIGVGPVFDPDPDG